MLRIIYNTFMISILFYIVIGVIYPSSIYLIGNVLFEKKANGSIVYLNSKPIGSKLIGQNFTSDKYFWGRPSAAGEKGYDALSSGASNYAFYNEKLLKRINDQVIFIKQKNLLPDSQEIPSNLIMASASGLDPHITVDSAKLQIKRIALARNISEEKVNDLINRNTEKPYLTFMGQELVNVLQLNVSLDTL
ncbi:potassium-transporting ATPase subunit KdpC [Pigmentibacter ruber]|nr:potassium-transporting ATPase subunit KdpC [Pigmentibacter ruber]